MTPIDKFFEENLSSPRHPLLRNWDERLGQEGMSAQLEVFWPESEIGFSDPEMYLHFSDNGRTLPLEKFDWNDELNDGLIHILKVRGRTQDDEARRFALALRADMRKAIREVGDGYFNAVLLEYLTENNLPEFSEIAEVMKYTYAARPSRSGKGYEYCREIISSAISRRARELIDCLGYPKEDATKILVTALARYIDERFTVSYRRRLGLL